MKSIMVTGQIFRKLEHLVQIKVEQSKARMVKFETLLVFFYILK